MITRLQAESGARIQVAPGMCLCVDGAGRGGLGVVWLVRPVQSFEGRWSRVS